MDLMRGLLLTQRLKEASIFSKYTIISCHFITKPQTITQNYSHIFFRHIFRHWFMLYVYIFHKICGLHSKWNLYAWKWHGFGYYLRFSKTKIRWAHRVCEIHLYWINSKRKSHEYAFHCIFPAKKHSNAICLKENRIFILSAHFLMTKAVFSEINKNGF